METECKRCKVNKLIGDFYRHPKARNGRDSTCKECRKLLNKTSNGKEVRNCVICKKQFNTTMTEINKGGGNCCSRKCWYIYFPKIVKRDKASPNWKGDSVGIDALHDWVKRNLGRPKLCEKCRSTKEKKYEWANISREYKRDLTDWIRLCKRCHIIFDGSKGQKNYKRLSIQDFKKLKI